MTSPLLRLNRLVKKYGEARVVDSLTLDMASNEFVTLLGGSGSGKTTTLMMIAGFITPDEGSILIDGKDVTHASPSERSIGVVFQNYSLFPHMSAFDNVAYPLTIRRVGRRDIADRVRAALELVQLTGMEGRKPAQLSGGQQQRVALARAIIFEPRLLLMDEPLGALDKKLRDRMQLEIMRIKEKLGVSIVYVTHDQDEALTMSDRVAVLNGGRLEQLDAPDDLYRRPANKFVADFVGEASFLVGKVHDDGSEGLSMEIAPEVKVGFAAQHPLGRDQAATLMVRPEVVRPSDELPDAANHVVGTVESAIYFGEYTKYRLVLHGGQELYMKRANHSDARKYGVGERLSVAWRHADGWLV